MPLSSSLARATLIKSALILGAVSLISCKALIAPNATTEVYKLRSGNYSVDKTHTRVLFKVNHLIHNLIHINDESIVERITTAYIIS